MWPLAIRLVELAFALLSPAAFAQSNVGELLDAGARRLSAEEFKAELVQRTIIGPTATGGRLEVIYAPNGSIQGLSATPSSTQIQPFPTMQAHVGGEWRIDDGERVCTAMQIQAITTISVLPPRCQYWFKLGDVYFLSDSDTDRRAKVLRRTLKP